MDCSSGLSPCMNRGSSSAASRSAGVMLCRVCKRPLISWRRSRGICCHRGKSTPWTYCRCSGDMCSHMYSRSRMASRSVGESWFHFWRLLRICAWRSGGQILELPIVVEEAFLLLRRHVPQIFNPLGRQSGHAATSALPSGTLPVIPIRRPVWSEVPAPDPASSAAAEARPTGAAPWRPELQTPRGAREKGRKQYCCAAPKILP